MIKEGRGVAGRAGGVDLRYTYLFLNRIPSIPGSKGAGSYYWIRSAPGQYHCSLETWEFREIKLLIQSYNSTTVDTP